MNNLKKFATEAEYTAATLNYPAVSWVTATDNVHFDKSVPTPPTPTNDKVKIAFTTDSCCGGQNYEICSSTVLPSLNSITVNGEPLEFTESSILISLENNTNYLIEYELKDNVTDVQDWFAIAPMLGCASATLNYDTLFPAQVTVISSLYENGVDNLILEATTPPPSVSMGSNKPNTFVPDSAVNTYKSSEGWSSMANQIFPISEYSGDIPV